GRQSWGTSPAESRGKPDRYERMPGRGNARGARRCGGFLEVRVSGRVVIVTIAHRTGVSFASRKRRLLQCGTALPLLLAAWPVLAAPIVENSSSDISVDADSATGSP